MASGRSLLFRVLHQIPVQVLFLMFADMRGTNYSGHQQKTGEFNAITYSPNNESETCFGSTDPQMLMLHCHWFKQQVDHFAQQNQAEYRGPIHTFGLNHSFSCSEVILSRFSIITTKMNSTMMAPA